MVGYFGQMVGYFAGKKAEKKAIQNFLATCMCVELLVSLGTVGMVSRMLV